MNVTILFLAAAVPLVVGTIWYHPRVFGRAWAKSAAISESTIQSSNLLLTVGLTYFLGLLLAVTTQLLVVHQTHVNSIFVGMPGFGQPGSEIQLYIDDFMRRFGNNYRTFRHGVFHGMLSGLFFVLPVISINALSERKSFRYVIIHTGYWTLCLALMGGLISAFPA
jgi:hypothetical protein